MVDAVEAQRVARELQSIWHQQPLTLSPEMLAELPESSATLVPLEVESKPRQAYPVVHLLS